MKQKLSKILPLILAAAIQFAPLLRTVLSIELKALAPASWAVILRIGTLGVGLFGFDAISSASSIAISPANATNGVPYVGTVTYSGSHAAEVSAMKMTNVCLTSSFKMFANLNIVYSGVNKATVSGTPTNTGTFGFGLTMYDGACSGLSDTRSSSLVIGAAGGGNVAPVMGAPPQGVTAQVGSEVLLSAGASGNPVPRYYWYLGVPSASTLVATNSSFSFANVQFTNAGLYTVVASNVAGQASATAYVSVCKTAGSNMLAFHYTNYVPVSNLVSLTSYITNAPAGSNTYKWQYNYVDITSYSTSGSNLTLNANSVYAGHSGIYSVVFNGVVGGTTVVDQQAYDSYWAFGSRPVVTASPQGTNVPAGTNVTLSASATVQQNPYGTNLMLGFLWYQNDTNLVSVQTSTGTNQSVNLNLPSVTTANAGTYTVVVTNFWGSTTSSPAVLNVAQSLGITAQPSSKAVLAGQNAGFTVTATGDGTLSYQWQKNSINLFDGGPYSGVNSNVLTVVHATTNEAGSYSVVISNGTSSTNSNPATLAVVAPPGLNFEVVGSGNLLISANTITGLNYIVESAPNLFSPIPWTPVATNSVPAGGVLRFTNLNTNSPQFFRLSFP